MIDLLAVGLVVPPLVDLKAVAGLRLGVGIGLNILLISVAYEGDSVIESCTTSIVLLDNTAGVELEGGLTSIKSNSEGLLLQLGLDFGD